MKYEDDMITVWSDEPNPKRRAFSVPGEELIEKTVTRQGNSGRVYLPVNWIGCRVAIVRLDEKRVDP